MNLEKEIKRKLWILAIISQILSVYIVLQTTALLNYLHPIVMVVLWGCSTFMVLFFGFLILKIKVKFPYRGFLFVLALYSVSLLILLFIRPADQTYTSWNLIPFATIQYFLSGEINKLVVFYNLAANIGLFLPFGFYLMVKRTYFQITKTQVIIWPVLIIILIETTQLITKRGSFDIDDILLNLLGIYLGYRLYSVFEKAIELRT